MYYFWGKDLLSEFSVVSILISGLKTFFLPSNLLFLPAWCSMIIWFLLLNRAQFKNWRLFFIISGILVCAGFGFTVILFLLGCTHTNDALAIHAAFQGWKAYAGPGLILISLLFLVWNLIRPGSKILTGILALICALASGLVFGLSYIFRLTDDLQFLLRTLTAKVYIWDGMNLLFSHALGMILPLVLLLGLIFIFFSFSKNRHYPPAVFSVIAFLILLVTGILTLTGHLGIYCS